MNTLQRMGLTSIIAVVSFSILAVPTLSNFNFMGASVIPYTYRGPKNERYVLLSREAAGKHKGTYDAFGGKRDPWEKHPVVTAGRELAEESVYLLGKPNQVQHYIGTGSPHTHHIIANTQKKFVMYITHFNQNALRHLTDRFYSARHKATNWKFKEKDKLAWVKWSDLERAIATAPCDKQGRIITPIKVHAQVIDGPRNRHFEHITIRPVLVGSLRTYFQHKPNFTVGKDQRIRFYTH
jgi:hypothetical protein